MKITKEYLKKLIIEVVNESNISEQELNKYAKIFVDKYGKEYLKYLTEAPDTKLLSVKGTNNLKSYYLSDDDRIWSYAEFGDKPEIKKFAEKLIGTNKIVDFWEKKVLKLIEKKFNCKFEW